MNLLKPQRRFTGSGGIDHLGQPIPLGAPTAHLHHPFRAVQQQRVIVLHHPPAQPDQPLSVWRWGGQGAADPVGRLAGG